MVTEGDFRDIPYISYVCVEKQNAISYGFLFPFVLYTITDFLLNEHV